MPPRRGFFPPQGRTRRVVRFGFRGDSPRDEAPVQVYDLPSLKAFASSVRDGDITGAAAAVRGSTEPAIAAYAAASLGDPRTRVGGWLELLHAVHEITSKGGYLSSWPADAVCGAAVGRTHQPSHPPHP
eukprot:Hpha_TRINITY_DN16098_c4_g12::TRINITY_DN16098_c4_g12_i1::g.119245::m.119245